MSEQGFNKISKALICAILTLAIASIVALITLLLGGISSNVFFTRSEHEAHESTKLAATTDYGQYYIDSMMFVGDSTVAGMIEAGALKDGASTDQVWTGESGDLPLDYNIDTANVTCSAGGTALTIAEAIKERSPDHVVITLGINNGVPYCTEQKFKEYYQKLITAIKDADPDAKIILQSILPVSEKYAKSTSGVTAEKINNANKWIAELAEQNAVRYLDTASALKNSKGYLDPKYDSGNGLILNAEGYNTVLTYIRTHGYK